MSKRACNATDPTVEASRELDVRPGVLYLRPKPSDALCFATSVSRRSRVHQQEQMGQPRVNQFSDSAQITRFTL